MKIPLWNHCDHLAASMKDIPVFKRAGIILRAEMENFTKCGQLGGFN